METYFCLKFLFLLHFSEFSYIQMGDKYLISSYDINFMFLHYFSMYLSYVLNWITFYVKISPVEVMFWIRASAYMHCLKF